MSLTLVGHDSFLLSELLVGMLARLHEQYGRGVVDRSYGILLQYQRGQSQHLLRHPRG